MLSEKFDRSSLVYSNEINDKTKYLPNDNLVDAVNIAISLGMPLLLQGEPGCGKTALAKDISAKFDLPLERFNVKSTSKAKDLLYKYDAISRLYDSELGDNGPEINNEAKCINPENYISYTSLGKIIIESKDNNYKPYVLLIDEIDKADMDFPNDLLYELEEYSFNVNETNKNYRLENDSLKPIVIITHNEEKSLPTAFLRRCIYHYIEFPSGNLQEILKIKKKDFIFNEKAIEKLSQLRNQYELEKKPSLKELIDWVNYLSTLGSENVEIEIDTLNKSSGILLKNKNDLNIIKNDIND